MARFVSYNKISIIYSSYLYLITWLCIIYHRERNSSVLAEEIPKDSSSDGLYSKYLLDTPEFYERRFLSVKSRVEKVHPKLKPSVEYSIDILWNLSYTQSHYLYDAFKIPFSKLNPSMIVDPTNTSRIVMIWRIMDKGHHDKVGYHWLDRSSYKVIKRPDFIEYFEGEQRHYLVGEDARIFMANGKMLMIYNTHLSKYKKVYKTEIVFHAKSDMFYAKETPIHINIDHEFGERHQKNWTPFEYCPGCKFVNGIVSSDYIQDIRQKLRKANFDPALQLYIYSIIPHRILYSIPTPDDKSLEHAHTVSLTKLLPQYKWEWGEMRGGSPAVLWNESHYISFFHSSGIFHQKWTISYYMGAYLFESKPPFAITHISTNPIVHANMINESLGWAYKTVDVIVFPCGIVLEDEFIYVSYGHNDIDGWVVKLKRDTFISSLERVESEIIGDSQWDQNDRVVPHSYRRINFTHHGHGHHRIHQVKDSNSPNKLLIA